MVNCGIKLQSVKEKFYYEKLSDNAYVENLREFRKGKQMLVDWIIFCLFVGFRENNVRKSLFVIRKYGKNMNLSGPEPTVEQNAKKMFSKLKRFATKDKKKKASKVAVDAFIRELSDEITFADAVQKLKRELETNKELWKKWEEDFNKFISVLTDNEAILCSNKKNRNAEEIIRLLKDGEKQVVLTGAPGTGKTYLAKEVARTQVISKLLENGDPLFKKHKDYHALTEEQQDKVNSYIHLVQFHPSYDYTDFVEGLRPTGIKDGQLSFGLKDGVFKKFCKDALIDSKKASNGKGNAYFFIIDEINRAELSKVFGELMYCLEKDYRGPEGAVETQYSALQEQGSGTIFDSNLPGKFYIPENVFIIGTMNDIDRSVEVFDFALRRRFAWFELKANNVMQDVLEGMLEGKLDTTKIDEITKKACKLNKHLSNEGKKFGLNDNYHIGPAYFGKIRIFEADQLDWQTLWERHIGPIIKEYVRNRKDADKFIEECKDIILDETDDTAFAEQTVSAGDEVSAEQPVGTGGGSDEQQNN